MIPKTNKNSKIYMTWSKSSSTITSNIMHIYMQIVSFCTNAFNFQTLEW
jgi:hypothetical protein